MLNSSCKGYTPALASPRALLPHRSFEALAALHVRHDNPGLWPGWAIHRIEVFVAPPPGAPMRSAAADASPLPPPPPPALAAAAGVVSPSAGGPGPRVYPGAGGGGGFGGAGPVAEALVAPSAGAGASWLPVSPALFVFPGPQQHSGWPSKDKPYIRCVPRVPAEQRKTSLSSNLYSTLDRQVAIPAACRLFRGHRFKSTVSTLCC